MRHSDTEAIRGFMLERLATRGTHQLQDSDDVLAMGIIDSLENHEPDQLSGTNLRHQHSGGGSSAGEFHLRDDHHLAG